MEAANDCVKVMAMLNDVEFLLSGVIKQCGNMIPEESCNSLNEIRKRLKDEIHQTDKASDSIFQMMQHLLSEYPTGASYRTIIVPKGYISYEDERRILISIPEPCEYGGYSIWFSRKFVTEDPSDGFLQVRYYPDWKLRLFKYIQAPSGSYYPENKVEVTADQLYSDFSIMESSVRYAEGYSLM